MPYVPTAPEWYSSLVSTMYILGNSQYHKSDRRALTRIQNVQLVVFADRFCKIDHWAMDTPMVYLQEHLPMPADNRVPQWQVSKLLQPSSTWHLTILAKESLWIQILPWTFLCYGPKVAPAAWYYRMEERDLDHQVPRNVRRKQGERSQSFDNCGEERCRGARGIGDGVRIRSLDKNNVRMGGEVLRRRAMWRGCFDKDYIGGV